MNTGGIAIEEQRYIACESAYHARLTISKACAQRGDSVGKSSLVHRHHIGIAFHKDAIAATDNRFPSLIKTVNLVALGVDGRIVGVFIFCYLFVVAHGAAAESHYLSGKVGDGESDAFVKTVVGGAVLKLHAYTRFHYQILAVTQSRELLHHFVLGAVGRVAKCKALYDVIRKASRIAVVGEGHIAAGRSVEELLAIVFASLHVDVVKCGSFALGLSVVNTNATCLRQEI